MPKTGGALPPGVNENGLGAVALLEPPASPLLVFYAPLENGLLELDARLASPLAYNMADSRNYYALAMILDAGLLGSPGLWTKGWYCLAI